jgi:hypothetical protein
VDALDLLFRRLVLAARASGALERPVTVGEVLDDFAPYAASKRDGQLDTHDDYLHALMRLISGERSLLFGDDLMQDDLKAELDSPNPDLAVLRTYTHTKLRVSTAGIASVLAGDTNIDLRPPTPRAPQARVTGAAQAPRPSGSVPRVPGPAAPPEPMTEPRSPGALHTAFSTYDASTRSPAAADAGVVTPPADTANTGCPYCAQALPPERAFKFCPSCGLNLHVRRCPGCSAEIESGWKFCVTCGRKA